MEVIATVVSWVVPARLMAIIFCPIFLVKTWPGPLTVITSTTPPDRNLSDFVAERLEEGEEQSISQRFKYWSEFNLTGKIIRRNDFIHNNIINFMT